MSVTINCILPKELEPTHEPLPGSGFVRLGKQWDGGYIVDLESVQKAQKLISFGVNNDWSFEAAFCQLNAVPLVAFDHSVSKRVYLRNFLIHSTVDFSPVQAYRNLAAFISYSFFFSGNKKHIRKHVGYASVPGMVDLDEALSIASTKEEQLFFKIDTEQWEYRILEDLIKNAHRITGLVIEFHHIDLHMERIKNFLDKFPLPLVYTRANNYGNYTPDRLPLYIECTFSATAVQRVTPFRSLSIDMPNSRKIPPYELSFE